MKDLIPGLHDKEWIIEEKKWDPEKQNLQETLLSTGNGFLGSRGVLEEIPEGSYAGTYFAGLYDSRNTQVTELVNTPNPVYFRITANGEELAVGKMKVSSHYRALDMRNGTLHRKTIFKDSTNQRYQLETFRFFSRANRHTGILRVVVTSLDGNAELEVDARVDDTVTNMGQMTEGNKMHYIDMEKTRVGKIKYLSDMTFEDRYLISHAYLVKVYRGSKETSRANDTFKMKAGQGEPICFIKYFSFYCTREKGVTDGNIKEKTVNELRQMLSRGFRRVYADHEKKWDETWNIADIKLKEGAEEQKALRYNIYNLIICANPHDEHASVGAKALTGEGYKGHIFWDMELFMLPFYIYTDPEAARAFLMYRFNNLEAARQLATAKGYRGALYPWESADKGIEVTPNFTVDLDGRIVETIIGEEEHINCDIAYGIFNYYEATRDKRFLLKYGLEVLFEISRYWASRLKWEKGSRAYGIHDVMGCDEFHSHIDNNAFTNVLVRFVMELSVKYYEKFSKSSPGQLQVLAENIDLKPEEVKKWRRLAKKIKMPPERSDKIIEEFDGYFKLKHYPIPRRGRYYLPELPEQASVRDLGQTQYVKQGDTLILLYLLSDKYDLETKKANYEYYEERTLHKSSLSPSAHAIIAAEIGDLETAFHYFQACLYTDIYNLYGNTEAGVHAASLGATWQVIVNGFCGMRISRDKLSFNPGVPPEIGGVDCMIIWRGRNLRIQATNDQLCLLHEAGSSKTIDVYVYGERRELKGGVLYTFRRDEISGGVWCQNKH